SFECIPLEQGLECIELVPACECGKCLLLAGAMMQIGPEHALDCCRRIFRLDVMVDFAPDARVGTKAAADVNVIAFDRIALLRHRYPGAKQADVADIMLRAGIGAAGEMDVHRRVELRTRLAPPRNL